VKINTMFGFSTGTLWHCTNNHAARARRIRIAIRVTWTMGVFQYPQVYGVYVVVVPFITLALNRCSESVRRRMQPHLANILKADQTVDQKSRFVYRCWKLTEVPKQLRDDLVIMAIPQVILLVLLGFFVLKDEPFTPPSLGGTQRHSAPARRDRNQFTRPHLHYQAQGVC